MSQKITTEEQFTFLISCIRHSEHGKVDFQKVANECTIVSKAAAAKRYERMMKAHGIPSSKTTSSPAHQSILNATVSSTSRKPASTKTTPTKTPKTPKAAANKRKFSDFEDAASAENDDDEGLLPKVKREKEQEYKTDAEKNGAIKEEKNGYYIIHHPHEEVGGFDGVVEVKEENGFKVEDKEDIKGFVAVLAEHGMLKHEGVGMVKQEVGVKHEEEIKKEVDEDGVFAMGYAGTDGSGMGVGNSIVIAD